MDPLVVTREVLAELVRLGHSTAEGQGLGPLTGIQIEVGAERVQSVVMLEGGTLRRLSTFGRDNQ
jgi:hypothetical protein